jgi:hypothetical protein
MHATPTLFADQASSDFYLFPIVEEKFERIQVRTRTSFCAVGRDFQGYPSKRIEGRISRLGAAGSRNEPR